MLSDWQSESPRLGGWNEVAASFPNPRADCREPDFHLRLRLRAHVVHDLTQFGSIASELPRQE